MIHRVTKGDTSVSWQNPANWSRGNLYLHCFRCVQYASTRFAVWYVNRKVPNIIMAIFRVSHLHHIPWWPLSPFIMKVFPSLCREDGGVCTTNWASKHGKLNENTIWFQPRLTCQHNEGAKLFLLWGDLYCVKLCCRYVAIVRSISLVLIKIKMKIVLKVIFWIPSARGSYIDVEQDPLSMKPRLAAQRTQTRQHWITTQLDWRSQDLEM